MQIIFPMAWKYTEICSKTGNKFTLEIALCREKETQAESSTQQVQQNILSFIFQARGRYLGGHYFILFFFGYLVYLIYVIITWLERDLVTAHMKQNKSWGIPLNHKLRKMWFFKTMAVLGSTGKTTVSVKADTRDSVIYRVSFISFC